MASQSLKSYANTSVGAGRTKEQIEKLIQKVGAVGFRWDSGLPELRDSENACGYEQLSALIHWHRRKLAFRLRIVLVFEGEDRSDSIRNRGLGAGVPALHACSKWSNCV